jgi:hypothetical protein
MNVKQTDAIIAVGWGLMSLILVYDGLFDALCGVDGAMGSPWLDWVEFFIGLTSIVALSFWLYEGGKYYYKRR